MAEVIRERVVERPAGTVYHEHHSNSGIIALVVALVLLFLLFYYGLPAIRSFSAGPTISVPKSVDVNINGATGGAPAPASK